MMAMLRMFTELRLGRGWRAGQYRGVLVETQGSKARWVVRGGWFTPLKERSAALLGMNHSPLTTPLGYSPHHARRSFTHRLPLDLHRHVPDAQLREAPPCFLQHPLVLRRLHDHQVPA